MQRSPAVVALIGTFLAVAWLVATHAGDWDSDRWFGYWRTRHLLVAAGLLWAVFGALLSQCRWRGLVAFGLGTAAAIVALLLIDGVHRLGGLGLPTAQASERVAFGFQPVPHLDLRGETRGDLTRLYGLRGEPMPYHFRTDHRGLRNAVDRDAADVYVVGDSIVLGVHVPQEATIPAQLERALGRPVMSVALADKGLAAQHALLRQADVPLDGRLVLQFVFEGNDLLDSRAERVAGGHAAERERPRSLLRHCLLRLQRASQDPEKRAMERRFRVAGEDYYFLWGFGMNMPREQENAEIPHLLAALDDIRADVEGHGGALAVVYVPSTLTYMAPFAEWPEGSRYRAAADIRHPLADRLAEHCAARGIPMLDVTEALRDAIRAGRRPAFTTDTHLTRDGHEAVAAAIARWDAVHVALDRRPARLVEASFRAAE